MKNMQTLHQTFRLLLAFGDHNRFMNHLASVLISLCIHGIWYPQASSTLQQNSNPSPAEPEVDAPLLDHSIGCVLYELVVAL